MKLLIAIFFLASCSKPKDQAAKCWECELENGQKRIVCNCGGEPEEVVIDGKPMKKTCKEL